MTFAPVHQVKPYRRKKSLAEISLSKGLLFNMDTFQTPSGIILYPKTTWYAEWWPFRASLSNCYQKRFSNSENPVFSRLSGLFADYSYGSPHIFRKHLPAIFFDLTPISTFFFSVFFSIIISKVSYRIIYFYQRKTA